MRSGSADSPYGGDPGMRPGPLRAGGEFDTMLLYESAALGARKEQHHHMQDLRDRLLSLRDRIAHVMVRL